MRDKKIFHFKQFSVRHDQVTMKVGTDGVLLGAWADVSGARHILDVGTGSGVIALMLAQRTGAETAIDGVEIMKQDFQVALENVSTSPWKERLKIFHTAIQEFSPDRKYGLMVSNPPYFENSLLPPDPSRTVARHTSTLTPVDLLHAAKRLLLPHGRLSLILPHQESNAFNLLALDYGFHCIRKTGVRSRREKPVERVLMEYAFKAGPLQSDSLILYGEKDMWSEKYRDLLKDFYLNF